MKKNRTVPIFIFLLLFALPVYADRSIKTVEYFIDQTTADRTAGVTYTSPQFYIYLPESGIQVRAAWIEVSWDGGNVQVLSAAIGVNGANTQTFRVLNYATSGENIDNCLRYNAMAAFSGLGTGNNGPYEVSVNIGNTTRTNESVKLYLTYEYDDTSPVQLKTVRFFVGSRNTTLGGASPQVFSHIPYIPEVNVNIRSLWYEIRGHYRNATAANHLTATITLNGGSSQTPKLQDNTNATPSEFLYLYKPATNPNTGVNNDLSFTPAYGTVYCLNAELVITYAFDYTASNTFINTVRRYMGQTTALGAANDTAYFPVKVYFPEAPYAPAVRSLYAVYRTTNSGAINFNIGTGTAGSTLAFAVNGSNVNEGRTILYNLLPWFPSLTDNSTVIAGSAWSAAGGGARCAELIYTYEYPRSATRLQKTVYYAAGTGQAMQDDTTGMGVKAFISNVYMPEATIDTIVCAVAYAKSLIGATADSRFRINIGGADEDFITLDNDIEVLYAERIKDVSSQITGPGAYTVNVNLQTTGNVNQYHLSSAITCLTYHSIKGRFKFITPQRTTTQNNPSSYIKIQAQTLEGILISTYNGTVSLSTSSSGGRFSLSRVNWQDTTIITLKNGEAIFYYRDSLTGNPVITASCRGFFVSDTQTETILAQSVNESASYITFSPYKIPADGISVCTAVVAINDTYGFPINNKLVTLQTSRGLQDTITGNPGTTDSNGQCTFTIKSSYAGLDTIFAMCDGVTITRGVNRYGAVGIWHFDTDIKDVSGSGNNGVFPSSIDFWPLWVSGPDAISGSALNFDGLNDYLSIPDSPNLDISEQITVEAWIYIDAFSNTTGWHSEITAKGPDVMRFFVRQDNHKLSVAQTYDGIPASDEGDTVLVANQWYHVAYTYKQPRLRLFVNGSMDREVSHTGALGINNNPLLIGKYDTNSLFNGVIDEVRIYNRALSPEEIMSSYRRRANISFTGNKLKIITPQRITKAGFSSESIVVEVQGSDGGVDQSFNDTVILSTSSNSGSFSISPVSWSDTTIITLSSGVGTFYYKDYQVGYPVITVSRANFIPVTQQETIISSAFRFVSSSFIINSIETSPRIIVIAADYYGETDTTFNETASLSSSSSRGKFSISNTNWAETSVVKFSRGVAGFYYRDAKSGNPVITISRTDLGLSDTQQETVAQPVISITKYQRNEVANPLPGDSTTSPVYGFEGDTIEYTISIKNTGTETATAVLIYDTSVFDTSLNHSLIFIEMDTSPRADSWSYTTDTACINWNAWGDVPLPGEKYVKGLRWKLNSVGINEVKNIKFRVSIGSSSGLKVEEMAVAKYNNLSRDDTQPEAISNTLVCTYTEPAISIVKYIKNLRTGIESETNVSLLGGDTIEFKIVWTQSGVGGPADTIVLTDYIPDSTTFITGSETVTYGKGSVSENAGMIKFIANDVLPGETGTFKFRVRVE